MLRSLRVSLLLLALLGGAGSCAGTPPRPAIAPRDQARKLYEEGRARAEAGQWAEARARHAEAFRLFPHWQIAGALGLAELHLGEHRDAAEHLALFLDEAPADEVSAAEKREMAGHLATAKARVGALVLLTEDGAEVRIDGERAGTAPFKRPVFVKPGKHTVEASLGGRRSASDVVAAAGAKLTVKLGLGASPGAGRPLTPAPEAAPTPAPRTAP